MEDENGIWVLGKRDKELCLLNLESLSVSDVALYWKSTDNPEDILKFFTNSFNGFKKFLIDLLKVKFEVVEVEINTETNELFIL
jgi:predicted RNA-binding protein (virulence factor B family)